MSKKAPQHSRMKQAILALVIALVTVFFVAYLIQTIYPAPEYSNFCDEKRTFKAIETQSECEATGGFWTDFDGERPTPDGKIGFCDLDYYCRQDYDSARESYEKNLFIANVILGLVILIFAFFLRVEAVSTGFMGGGAILIIYGTLRYWSNLSNLLRTLILGAALVVIVWFAYKKFK